MIVVAGEALMDVFDAGATPTGVALDARMGGSPFNVAVGLARLGVPVSFFGAVSTGFLGERLVAALRAEAVATAAVVRLARPTTLALVGVDARGVPDYAFYGEGAADRNLGIDALDRVPDAAAVHFGSYSMVVEPTATTLLRLAEHVHGRAVISWDPNVRVTVEPDLDRWRAVAAAMVPLATVVKVSDEDIACLWPAADIDGLARGWLAAGAGLVVVTRGAAGVSAWTRHHRLDLPAQAVVVVDTVGAGDSFQAALLAGLAGRDRLSVPAIAGLSRDDLAAVLEVATVAAAVTCSRRGADLPRRTDIAGL